MIFLDVCCVVIWLILCKLLRCCVDCFWKVLWMFWLIMLGLFCCKVWRILIWLFCNRFLILMCGLLCSLFRFVCWGLSVCWWVVLLICVVG